MSGDPPTGPQSPTSAAPGLAVCCRASAVRYLRRHRDAATCDTCGMLLLAYGNDRDFDETRRALTEQQTPFSTDRHGALWIVAKARTPRSRRGKPR